MHDEDVAHVEEQAPRWGSDAVAAALRATGVEFIALNPGSSYRGLHDSLVNFLGNAEPKMLVCLHEEHAVSIAHGYAKATGRPMAVALHANVGLMHASMAIFNAYGDRVPMLVLGATGPLDAMRRRPWIDWLHTSADQAAMIRPFIKWDDQPGSAAAAVASVVRGNQITRTQPCAPVYVCLDVGMQEAELTEPVTIPDVRRFAPVAESEPAEAAVDAAVTVLDGAERIVLLAGPVGHSEPAWRNRIELAERLGARVITDIKVGAAFPTDHPLHSGPSGLFMAEHNLALIREAEVVLSLGWLDLGGTLRSAFGDQEPSTSVISATLDHQLWNGWSKLDHYPHPTEVSLHSTPDRAVAALLDKLPQRQRISGPVSSASPDAAEPVGATGRINPGYLQAALAEATRDQPVTLIRVPFAWDAARWPVTEPLAYLGSDGGAGVGAGPGLAVGSALGLRGTGRLPVAVLGDGDYLMGVSALWTAARYGIPLLVVVANNNSFFNDEVHQGRVARTRARPLENAHVGMRIEEPDPDLAGLARDLGLTGFGPVRTPDELAQALPQAVRAVRDGGQAVVDVRVERGYQASTARSIAGSA